MLVVAAKEPVSAIVVADLNNQHGAAVRVEGARCPLFPAYCPSPFGGLGSPLESRAEYPLGEVEGRVQRPGPSRTWQAPCALRRTTTCARCCCTVPASSRGQSMATTTGRRSGYLACLLAVFVRVTPQRCAAAQNLSVALRSPAAMRRRFMAPIGRRKGSRSPSGTSPRSRT